MIQHFDPRRQANSVDFSRDFGTPAPAPGAANVNLERSEERRVGKECER